MRGSGRYRLRKDNLCDLTPDRALKGEKSNADEIRKKRRI